MSKRYLSGDEIADARNARGFGVSWERIAGHMGVSVSELQAALGEPQWKSEPAIRGDKETGVDLWSMDRLADVL